MEVTLIHVVLLLAVGIGAGVVNAIAGGAAYFIFPALIGVGLTPIFANTTTKSGIWFGALGSMTGYWREIQGRGLAMLLGLAGMAFIGSLGGSLLLLVISNELFRSFVPWLMLGATIAFAFGQDIVYALRTKVLSHAASPRAAHLSRLLGVGCISVYGGFFGAGMAFFFLALFQMTGIHDMYEANALKVLVTFIINTISAITFMLAGKVVWSAGIPLMVGAVIGGYLGAGLAKRVPREWIQLGIIAYASCITTVFFGQYFFM